VPGPFHSGGHGDAVEVDVCRKMQALVRRADALMPDRSHVVRTLWEWTSPDEVSD
jgi:hypothetical protein